MISFITPFYLFLSVHIVQLPVGSGTTVTPIRSDSRNHIEGYYNTLAH